MAKLQERLNFSDIEIDNSIKIDKRRDVNFYETLCLYCSKYNIDLEDTSEEDFDGCVELMKDFGSNDLENNPYFFSIDN